MGREVIPKDLRVYLAGKEMTMDEAALLVRRIVGTNHLGGWARVRLGMCLVMASVSVWAAAAPMPMEVGTLWMINWDQRLLARTEEVAIFSVARALDISIVYLATSVADLLGYVCRMIFPLAVNLARQHCSSGGTTALTAVKTAVVVTEGGSGSEVSMTISRFTLVNSGLKMFA